MREIAENLLKFGIMAPSGDNCQPWLFDFTDTRIEVFIDTDRDRSLYNYKQKAALVAHGALLENMIIAANALGAKLRITLFPDDGNQAHVATVQIEETEPAETPLFQFIPERATNRQKFQNRALSGIEKSALLESAADLEGVNVALVDERQICKKFAEIAAKNDRLVFTNYYLHQFLYEQVRWNDRQAEETRDGLDIKTFELNKFDEFGFGIMRHWPIVKSLNKVGLYKKIQSQSQKNYQGSSAFGIVAVNGKSDKELVVGGQAMQRVWLEATRLGFSYQPVGGIICLINRVLDGETDRLAPDQVDLLLQIKNEVWKLFQIQQDMTGVMFFRIGPSAPPSARALRRPLVDVMSEKSPTEPSRR